MLYLILTLQLKGYQAGHLAYQINKFHNAAVFYLYLFHLKMTTSKISLRLS